MKAASINEIKAELEQRSHKELLGLCMSLAKFKKENKELCTFILFEECNLTAYVENVKNEMTQHFEEINNSNVYYIKKSVRKILRNVSKQIKFAASKQVEAELLIHFCNSFTSFSIPIEQSIQLKRLYENQLHKIDLAIASLHPDLQYDLRKQMY